MAGDSAVVSKMHRPGLLTLGFGPLSLPLRPSLVSCPQVGKKGLPFGHYPGCSLSPLPCSAPGTSVPFSCSGLFSASYSPPHPCSLCCASCWEPPLGEFPRRLRVWRGFPPWEPGQPLSSQTPVSLGAASPASSPPGIAGSSPIKWGRGFRSRTGRGAPQGAGSKVRAACPRWQWGRVWNAEPGFTAWAGERTHHCTIVLLPSSVGVSRVPRLMATAGIWGAGGAFAAQEVVLEQLCWLDGGCERARRGYLYGQLCCVGGCGREGWWRRRGHQYHRPPQLLPRPGKGEEVPIPGVAPPPRFVPETPGRKAKAGGDIP